MSERERERGRERERQRQTETETERDLEKKMNIVHELPFMSPQSLMMGSVVVVLFYLSRRERVREGIRALVLVTALLSLTRQKSAGYYCCHGNMLSMEINIDPEWLPWHLGKIL